MHNKCKVGDLAVITDEESGLEVNIGRFVWVHKGPFLDADYGPEFVIEPATEQPTGSLARDGRIDYDRSSASYHPDAWMVPVWRPSPCRTGELRAPLGNLPKLSREWLDAVMRGEA